MPCPITVGFDRHGDSPKPGRIAGTVEVCDRLHVHGGIDRRDVPTLPVVPIFGGLAGQDFGGVQAVRKTIAKILILTADNGEFCIFSFNFMIYTPILIHSSNGILYPSTLKNALSVMG